MSKLVKETAAELHRKKEKTILIRYLVISFFCQVFFQVYSCFSHGIHSPWMTFLFVWPLVLGAFPAALMVLGILPEVESKPAASTAGKDKRRFAPLFEEPGGLQKDIYRFGVAAITVASMLRGVLDIAGTYSSHTTFLLCVGAVLVLTGGITYILALAGAGSGSRIRRK